MLTFCTVGVRWRTSKTATEPPPKPPPYLPTVQRPDALPPVTKVLVLIPQAAQSRSSDVSGRGARNAGPSLQSYVPTGFAARTNRRQPSCTGLRTCGADRESAGLRFLRASGPHTSNG